MFSTAAAYSIVCDLFVMFSDGSRGIGPLCRPVEFIRPVPGPRAAAVALDAFAGRYVRDDIVDGSMHAQHGLYYVTTHHTSPSS